MTIESSLPICPQPDLPLSFSLRQWVGREWTSSMLPIGRGWRTPSRKRRSYLWRSCGSRTPWILLRRPPSSKGSCKSSPGWTPQGRFSRSMRRRRRRLNPLRDRRKLAGAPPRNKLKVSTLEYWNVGNNFDLFDEIVPSKMFVDRANNFSASGDMQKTSTQPDGRGILRSSVDH